MDKEKVISDIEQQIRWIEEIECHKFPGWLNVTNAMRDALALLKEQDKIIQNILLEKANELNDKVTTLQIEEQNRELRRLLEQKGL